MSISACSSYKYLQPGQTLYTGAGIQIIADSSHIAGGSAKALESSLKELTRPIPNKKLLGWRYKLFFYNIAGHPKKQKGFKYWLKNKMGEAPVLTSYVNINNNNRVLQSYLQGKGYLQAAVTGQLIEKEKTGSASYKVAAYDRYKIDTIRLPADTGGVNRIITNSANKTLVKKGNYYDLDVFKSERERIDNLLKEKGYYYFSPDFILFQADSTIGNHGVNITVKVKDLTPYPALKPYYIRNINIYPNYTLNRDSVIRKTAPVVYNDFKIYDPRNAYKPKLFDRLIFFKKGDVYSRFYHNMTLNRLVNIGTFKFVKAEFRPVDTLRSNLLDADFYLTSLKKKSLTLEVLGTSKSNNFVGSEITINHINRNLFKGAEQLTVGLSGGFETQVGGQLKGANSYSMTAKTNLVFPRFIFPFFDIKSINSYVPKTHITLGYQVLRRALFYTLTSANGEFGYIWKGNELNEHELNPFAVSYIRTLNTTDSFNVMLSKIPTLRSSFENQFIFSTNYRYTYTNQSQDWRRNNFIFTGKAETAGNLVNAFLKKDTSGIKQLFNTPVNQFFRFEGDFRDYFKLTGKVSWASRLNVGIGIPYGNSTILPYVRQFFAGGTNDIRAFRARSLGPGSYDASALSKTFFTDQGGDIKFLVSSELRSQLFSIFQGALFVDAGNIWLARNDPQRPGSKFMFGKMFNEMAVGGGAGLRVDAKIFVVRFDLAIPFRKPFLPEGQRWVINKINFGDPAWRKENLILNIGIGYPF